MRSTLLHTLFAAIVLICSWTTSLAAPAKIRLEKVCAPVYVRQRIQVEVRLDTEGQPVSFVGAFIKFDPKQLLFVPSRRSEPIFNNLILTGYPWEYMTGMVSLTGATNTPMTGSDLLLAKLDFDVLAPGTTDVSVSVESPQITSLTDNQFRDLPFTDTPLQVFADRIPPFELGISPISQKAAVGEQVSVLLNTGFSFVEDLSPEPDGGDAYIRYNTDVLRFSGGDLNPMFPILPNESIQPMEVAPGIVRVRLLLQPGILKKSQPKGEPCGFASPPPVFLPGLAELRFTAVGVGNSDLEMLDTYPWESRFYTNRSSLGEPTTVLSGAEIAVDSEAETSVALDGSPKFVATGESFTLSVNLRPAASVNSVQTYLAFDPERLEFQGGDLNEFNFNNLLLNIPPAEAAAGVIRFVASATTPPIYSTRVATLRFRARSAGLCNFDFLSTAPQASTVSRTLVVNDPDEGEVVVIEDVPAHFHGASLEVRNRPENAVALSPAHQEGRIGQPVDIQVMLSMVDPTQGGAPPPGRQFTCNIGYDSAALEFAGGTVNAGLFETTAAADQPRKVVMAGGKGSIVTFTGRSDTLISAPDLQVATLRFIPRQEGFSPLDVQVSGPYESRLETKTFRPLPLVRKTAGIVGVGPNPTLRTITFLGFDGSGYATYDALFSEPVVGVDAADFALQPGLAGASVLNVVGENPISTGMAPFPQTVDSEHPLTADIELFEGIGPVGDLNLALQLVSVNGAAPIIELTHVSSGRTATVLSGDDQAAALLACLGSAPGLRFDDEAEATVRTPCTPGSTYVVRPTGALNAFDGLSAEGPWKLTVSVVGSGSLEVQSWSLTIAQAPSARRTVIVDPGTGSGRLQLGLADAPQATDLRGLPLLSSSILSAAVNFPEDSDRDGLDNRREVTLGTDPSLRDTDSDGFEDGVEVALGTDPLDSGSPAVGTDADNDGIPDALDNNPNSIDSDGDHFLDSYEIAVGSDPNSRASVPPLGDADGSGVAEFIDAVVLFNVFLGNLNAGDYAESSQLDLNRDGFVDSVDGVILFNWYIGNIHHLPL